MWMETAKIIRETGLPPCEEGVGRADGWGWWRQQPACQMQYQRPSSQRRIFFTTPIRPLTRPPSPQGRRRETAQFSWTKPQSPAEKLLLSLILHRVEGRLRGGSPPNFANLSPLIRPSGVRRAKAKSLAFLNALLNLPVEKTGRREGCVSPLIPAA